MKYLGPTRHARLNEAGAVVFLLAGLFVFFSLASYHAFDPSLNTASAPPQPVNLTGLAGAYFADFFLQTLGLGAYAIPVLILILGWMWIRSAEIDSPAIKIGGGLLLVASTCCLLGLIPAWRPIAGMIPAGGLIGSVLADAMVGSMNLTGTILATMACWIVSLYLVSTFEMAHVLVWFRRPWHWIMAGVVRFSAWREERARQARLRGQARVLRKALDAGKGKTLPPGPPPPGPPIVDPLTRTARQIPRPPEFDDIPIRILDFAPAAESEPVPPAAPPPIPAPAPAKGDPPQARSAQKRSSPSRTLSLPAASHDDSSGSRRPQRLR